MSVIDITPQQHLITPTEFRSLARPVSVHTEEDEINAYIEESEQVHIIPAIGYELFAAVLGEIQGGTYEYYGGLAEGSTYTDECGETKYNVGLKKTLAYFVYAHMAKADGQIITRSGFMRHDDAYGSHIDDTNKKHRYNEVMDIAEHYLSGVLDYVEHLNSTQNGSSSTCCNQQPSVRGTRAKIHAIGD